MIASIRKRRKTSFRFGDGYSVESEKTVTVPAKIGKKNIMIKTNVIDTNLPLLLRKQLKKANLKIDFSNETVSMSDRKDKIVFTSRGHYPVPISETNYLVEDFDKNNQVGQVYLTISELSKKSNDQKLKITNALNCQLGLPSPEKLKKLIKKSNINDKKPRLRPIISFSLLKDFNDVVAADLKSINRIMILRMIDHATRFSAASVKKIEEAVDAFIKH